MKSFEAANPGVKVEITSLPWSQAFQKFATMVSAGDMPDIVEMPDRGCRSMPTTALSRA